MAGRKVRHGSKRLAKELRVSDEEGANAERGSCSFFRENNYNFLCGCLGEFLHSATNGAYLGYIWHPDAQNSQSSGNLVIKPLACKRVDTFIVSKASDRGSMPSQNLFPVTLQSMLEQQVGLEVFLIGPIHSSRWTVVISQ